MKHAWKAVGTLVAAVSVTNVLVFGGTVEVGTSVRPPRVTTAIVEVGTFADTHQVH